MSDKKPPTPGHAKYCRACEEWNPKPTPTPEQALRRVLSLIDGLPWHLRDAVYKAYNERVGALPGKLPEPIEQARALLNPHGTY